MIDPRNDTTEAPRLTEDQGIFLARIRNTRKHGYMLTMEECDLLIQIVEELSR
jgi:hypothetical protein